MSLMASGKLNELFKEGIMQTIYKLFQKIKKVRMLSILLCEVNLDLKKKKPTRITWERKLLAGFTHEHVKKSQMKY